MEESNNDIGTVFELRKDNDEVSQVERLLNEFEAHESKEEQAIENYRKLLADVQNPVTRFVMQMILSDEERHRAVTHSMVSTLKGSLTWSKPTGTLEGGADEANINRQLLAMTDEFIEFEKSGIKDYKVLLKQSADYYHGLFKILLNSMIRDSEKHVELLEFIQQRVKAYE
jgi:bacterioferritin (cytochrome b1)